MADLRRAVHAYLSDEAHDAWNDLAAEHGVSLSGLFEALAHDFTANPPNNGSHPRWDEIIRATRKIDVERRRRGGPPRKPR